MSPSQFHSLLKTSQLDKLRAAVKTTSGENSNSDEGYWKPTVDKAGNGSAIIRFLPAPPPESEPATISTRPRTIRPPGAEWPRRSDRRRAGPIPNRRPRPSPESAEIGRAHV